ncbi:MAG: tRNA (adenosine(37)-N6)-threonylcarbamoyltransferase complex ATPase subunit type 1 TsaE [Lysobacteraceae bacterium]
MQLNLPDVAATEALGAALAATRPARAVVYLHGDLGAGKSTLARALLRALGVRGAIRSPTYTLIEPYRLDGGDEAVHLDLYRIAAAEELEFLGLDELAAQAALWLVEWPERGGKALPQADLLVNLAVDGDGRSAVLEGRTGQGLDWLERALSDINLAHFLVVNSR